MNDTPNVGSILSSQPDPDRIALIDYADGDPPREWTAGALDTLANALARGLLKRGLKRGDSIVVLSANRAEFAALYFGAMRVGLVVVPVNWKLAADTIALIVEDAEAKLVFTDAERARLAPASVPRIGFGEADWRDLFDPGPVEIIQPEPDEPAQILYTSGSTGRPKGVPLSHRGQHWMVKVVSREDYSGHCIIVAAPMYHMNALFNLKFSLMNRALLVLQPVFTAESYVKAIVTHKATWLTCVPTMMALVASHLGDRPPPPEFAGVTRLFMGSSPFSQALVDRVRAMFPNARIINGYGTTEAGAAVYGPHPDGVKTPDTALGYPIAEGETRLVDPDGKVVEGEGVGVLQMRNPATMQGYRNMPEKTAAALRDGGWYHSGDVVRRDEHGFHHFVGREDDMFNCGGENIWPAAVEKLLESHPAISQAVVVPMPDDVKQFLPVAFVTLKDGESLTEREVKDWALARGPAYQHPRRVVFLEAIPLAGTNKIDRTGLTKKAAQLAGAA